VDIGEMELMRNKLIELAWVELKIKLPIELYSFAVFNYDHQLYILGGKMENKIVNNKI